MTERFEPPTPTVLRKVAAEFRHLASTLWFQRTRRRQLRGLADGYERYAAKMEREKVD